MPIFRFTCPNCGRRFAKLVNKEFDCPDDGLTLVRDIDAGPSINSKEVLDNGLWPKKVEQYSNAADLVKEAEDRDRDLKNKKTL